MARTEKTTYTLSLLQPGRIGIVSANTPFGEEPNTILSIDISNTEGLTAEYLLRLIRLAMVANKLPETDIVFTTPLLDTILSQMQQAS